METQFSKVEEDFLFFLEHTNEIDETIGYYERALRELLRPTQTCSLLEYGPGSGELLSRLLSTFSPSEVLNNLEVTLIEPNPSYQEQALASLEALPLKQLNLFPTISDYASDANSGSVDVMLSNHVFYYVPKLQDELEALFKVLKSNGVLLTSLVSLDHPMVRIFRENHEKWGIDRNRHFPEEIQQALEAFHPKIHTEEVHSELVFEDSPENRLKFVRFLTVAPEKVQPEWLSCLDDYLDNGKIRLELVDLFHTIRR